MRIETIYSTTCIRGSESEPVVERDAEDVALDEALPVGLEHLVVQVVEQRAHEVQHLLREHQRAQVPAAARVAHCRQTQLFARLVGHPNATSTVTVTVTATSIRTMELSLPAFKN